MTHKIKVQMFGNFRMDYNGAPFVAEKMHKESQFNRMMQALIHYSDCGIAKDKLEEIVIGERDIDAPHTALRVIVYKTKQKLAQLGLPGKNLIYLEGGIYYWTPDIEIEEDAAEFEKLYNEACALEKQMPQEPESAETVCDERIKEIEDNMLELYVKALYLYKGEFLAAYTGETWIAQEARRYHIMFEKIINEAAYILRKRTQFKGLEKLGVYAAKVDPFNEWEELIMEAMVETRRYDEAEELYTDVVDYYLRECGIYPSSRLLEILEKYSNQMNHAHEILENIQEGMNEQEETERGGYFCSYPVFKGIYQASIRIMKRTRVPVYLMLCTLEDEEGRQVQSETKMNKYSRQFKKCVGESIRYSDIWQDKDWIFRSKTDFIAFFIRCAGLEDTAVYFNSLSYPFFASQTLAPNGFRDALFWHEPVGDEIPGNMQIILHDQGTRAKRVFVSRRESYDRLIALGAPSDKVKQLGYIYSFVRENKHRPHILVCTNSENVGHLTELASLMPQMHFHVAAITEMSSKLMSAGQYDNVSLYPNVKMSVLDSLFEKCDFYLDINHEGEIVDAVHRAFLNNMLIVGYEETMHNAYYTADTNTFKESEYADMAEALNLTLAMPHLIDEALAMQKKAAVAADATDYMEILHL